LPNLLGRIAIGADGANPLGSTKESDDVSVNRSDLPGSGEEPLSDDQPSLAVNYLLATAGNPLIHFLLIRWDGRKRSVRLSKLANGQLLPIGENASLFDLIGTTHGGDGVTDFVRRISMAGLL
jgi:hypothetical protein